MAVKIRTSFPISNTPECVFYHIERNTEDISDASKVGLSAGQIKALVDYLDANAIEYILKDNKKLE